jgi:maleate isomerase
MKRQTRIAMLTPSSNTVVEPYTSAMVAPLSPDVSVHFGRFRVTTIALDENSNGQFAREPILQAADLLADARPNVIAWNGTSASWLGFERDEALCREITDQTGIAATSAILSLNQILREIGVERLGLITPYTADVQERIMSNYGSIGIDVVSERHAGQSDNFSFSEISEETIAAMCEDVAAARPEAIAIVCTNMRGPLIAAALEQRLGIPVLDSIAFTLWGCLRATGTSMKPLSKFGSIFAKNANPR